MKQTRAPLVLTLLLTTGMVAMGVMPVQADQEDAAMKAVADRMKQSDAFAEELRRKREERRLEAERQAQQSKGADSEKKVEPLPVVQAPKRVIQKASTSSAAERKAQEAERKAQEAERKAQEAERKAKEAVARMEQAERERQAMLVEQRAKEETLKAQALALQQQQQQPKPLASASAPKKDDAWSRIPDECRDPSGTAAEIERLCGAAPGSANKEAKKETAPSTVRK